MNRKSTTKPVSSSALRKEEGKKRPGEDDKRSNLKRKNVVNDFEEIIVIDDEGQKSDKLKLLDDKNSQNSSSSGVNGDDEDIIIIEEPYKNIPVELNNYKDFMSVRTSVWKMAEEGKLTKYSIDQLASILETAKYNLENKNKKKKIENHRKKRTKSDDFDKNMENLFDICRKSEETTNNYCQKIKAEIDKNSEEDMKISEERRKIEALEAENLRILQEIEKYKSSIGKRN